ncbi:hypothetical protein [Paenibacillus pinihumi]|uniref:hypothetical protein n=1 Tax=Paenibacillus pinihumi TaxID=669462 RepID=UPI000416FB4D|nr:hypothetical protein [Paenibacillus pinihumi]
MASNKEQLNNSIEVKEELQQSSDKNSQPGIKPGMDYIWGSDQDELNGNKRDHDVDEKLQ